MFVREERPPARRSESVAAAEFPRAVSGQAARAAGRTRAANGQPARAAEAALPAAARRPGAGACAWRIPASGSAWRATPAGRAGSAAASTGYSTRRSPAAGSPLEWATSLRAGRARPCRSAASAQSAQSATACRLRAAPALTIGGLSRRAWPAWLAWHHHERPPVDLPGDLLPRGKPYRLLPRDNRYAARAARGEHAPRQLSARYSLWRHRRADQRSHTYLFRCVLAAAEHFLPVQQLRQYAQRAAGVPRSAGAVNRDQHVRVRWVAAGNRVCATASSGKR